MSWGYYYSNSYTKDEKERMLQDIENCKGDHLIISEGLERFDFALLKEYKNITKITLPRSFTSLYLDPFKKDFSTSLNHIKEIFVPLTVTKIDFINDEDESDYNWPHLTLEKRNPVYFQYEHGIYYKQDSTLIYVDDDFTVNFTFFMNTNHITENAFKNKKITELTIPKGISLESMLGYRFINEEYNYNYIYSRNPIYFKTCKNLKAVHFENLKENIRPSWFLHSNTYSSFSVLLPSLLPTNLTMEDKVKYIHFEVKGLAQKSLVPQNIKTIWFSYIKEHLKYFYKEIINDEFFFTFLIDNNLLTLKGIKELVSLLKGKPSVTSENMINQLTSYQQSHFTASDLEKCNKQMEKEDIRQKELLKTREESKKKQQEMINIRKQWQCSRNGNYEWYITSYKGTDENIIIPKELSGKTVTGIDKEAFSPMAKGLTDQQIKVRKNIKSITMPDTITEVCEHAFYGCTNLSTIKLSSSAKLGNVFSYDQIFGLCRNLKEITIPEGITELYVNALCCNEFLEKINLPSTLKIIHENAFFKCKRLKEINIPEGVKIIKTSAFNSCSSLKVIDIPKSVEEMEYCVFSFCKNLEYVVIRNPNIKMKDDIFGQANENLTIIGYKDSNVSAYAKKYNINFQDNIDSFEYSDTNKKDNN